MKTVLIYSGGLDSTVLLYKLLHEGYEVLCLCFNYGQRHKKELDAAMAITDRLKVDIALANLPMLKGLLGGSSQTSDDVEVPEGHYEEESMKQTVVPNRNMVMLSIAAGHAMSLKYNEVHYAAHTGDHAIYLDCGVPFVNAMKHAIINADLHKVILRAPFVDMDKADIVLLGHELKVPFELTWSCYKGLDKHCGKCGTCVERKEAFKLAGIVDPTIYME